jgi:hypothetical protein
MRNLFVPLVLVLAALSCGGNPGGPSDGGVIDFGPGNCTLPGSDPACGMSCFGDDACPDNLYCEQGMCVAQCTDQSPCPGGYLCAKGRCLQVTGPNAANCTNLECKQVDCTPAGGVSTTLTGKVYAPNGTLPLYNAIVYVPNGQTSPFTEGVTCDVCGALQSGQPITAAVTGVDGSFTLQNVPVSDNLPLVIQVGKWRRQVTIPKIKACQAQALTDPELTRLPRNRSEGDIPKMAIATGRSDPFECLLLKMGLAASEITRPTENGRVHFYRLNGVNMSPAAPQADDGTNGLYPSLDKLKTYDVVMLPCEGSPILNNKNNTALQNIVDYSAAGGRVFATHYSYVWLNRDSNTQNHPFPGLGTWDVQNDPDYPSEPFFGTIDTSFPKGMAFQQWLTNVNALESMGANAGKLNIDDPRKDIITVSDPPAKRWIYSDTGSQPKIVQHFTFNTPLMGGPLDDGGMPIQCGRVVFSDFHVSANARIDGMSFPNSCKMEELSGQEKALVFMLFDLSACVQDDNKPVEPPIF